MRTHTPLVGLLCGLLSFASMETAQAQNSTNAAPPSAQKEGGSEGDPNGAIRAMGGTEATGFQPKGTVTVPAVGGQGSDSIRHAPAGTGQPPR